MPTEESLSPRMRLRFHQSLIRSPRVFGIPVGLKRPVGAAFFAVVFLLKPQIGNFAFPLAAALVVVLGIAGESWLTRWEGNVSAFFKDIVRERPYLSHRTVSQRELE